MASLADTVVQFRAQEPVWFILSWNTLGHVLNLYLCFYMIVNLFYSCLPVLFFFSYTLFKKIDLLFIWKKGGIWFNINSFVQDCCTSYLWLHLYYIAIGASFGTAKYISDNLLHTSLDRSQILCILLFINIYFTLMRQFKLVISTCHKTKKSRPLSSTGTPFISLRRAPSVLYCNFKSFFQLLNFNNWVS